MCMYPFACMCVCVSVCVLVFIYYFVCLSEPGIWCVMCCYWFSFLCDQACSRWSKGSGGLGVSYSVSYTVMSLCYDLALFACREMCVSLLSV